MRASVWDVCDAWDGYALSKGIKKQGRLSEDDVAELRRELELTKKLERAKHGNAGRADSQDKR